MTYQDCNPITVAQILALVSPEIERATSRHDLKTRLAQFGYGFRDTENGRVLTTLPHGVELARFP